MLAHSIRARVVLERQRQRERAGGGGERQVAGALGALGDPVEDRRRRSRARSATRGRRRGAAVQQPSARLDDQRRVRVREQQPCPVADDVDLPARRAARRPRPPARRPPGRRRARAGRRAAAAPARGRRSRTALAPPRARRTRRRRAVAPRARRAPASAPSSVAAEVARHRERQLRVRGAAHKPRVQLDDQLLVHRRVDVRAHRQPQHLALQRVEVGLQPAADRAGQLGAADATSRTGPLIATPRPA